MKNIFNENEEFAKIIEKYRLEQKELYKKDPEQAKKKAMESLRRTGIIDEQGNLLPPYNGQKVNENDFTMGPGEIEYSDER